MAESSTPRAAVTRPWILRPGPCAAVCWLLLGILVLLPLQRALTMWPLPKGSVLSRGIRWVDEGALALLLPLVVWARLASRRLWYPHEGKLLIAMAAFGLVATVSALVNGVAPVTWLLGTADYLKAFAYLFVFSTFAQDRVWLERFYKGLLALALAGVLIALAQEAYALYVSHVQGLRPPSRNRLGVFRVSSIFGHQNAMGLYLLMFTLLESSRSRPRIWRCLLLYAGAALSMSRVVHAAFAVLALPLLRRRLWLVLPIALSAVLVFFTAEKSTRDLWEGPDQVEEEGFGGVGLDSDDPLILAERERINPDQRFRPYARQQALAVWSDHPVLGVGPGRFGGVVSLHVRSEVYRDYGWNRRQLLIFSRVGSLDQFWPQALAEVGALGTAAFAAILLAILLALWRLRGSWREDPRMAELATGVLLAYCVVPFYLLGSGLNLGYYLITVLGFAGALLSSKRSA